ncbi:MAG: hypothetical protein U5K69_16780 [Balneolaceae bacterium]|nr:hypothetical protein [Balneolaceae bacterium]
MITRNWPSKTPSRKNRIKAGKRFDYMPMPGQRHSFGDYTPYIERLMWDYFTEHLLGYHPDEVNYDIPDYEE